MKYRSSSSSSLCSAYSAYSAVYERFFLTDSGGYVRIRGEEGSGGLLGCVVLPASRTRWAAGSVRLQRRQQACHRKYLDAWKIRYLAKGISARALLAKLPVPLYVKELGCGYRDSKVV